MGPPLMHDTVEIMTEVNNAVKNSKKSVLFTMMSQDENIPKLQKSAPEHPPLYKFPEPPARALGEMLKFKKWQTREIKKKITFEVKKENVQKILDSIKIKGEFYLEFKDVYEILKSYGLPVIESVTVLNETEAVKAAQKLKFPVVLKCIGKELIHKTDVGGVKLNIKNEPELSESIKQMRDNLSSKNLLTKLEGYLLQPYYKGGLETILGIINDKSAGHLIMFGLGGIMVEILKDVKFRLAGIDETDAHEMIQSLKGYEILKGIRGKEGIDIDFAAENLIKLSRLVQDFPCIEELDLNPFVFSSDKNKCKILDARIKLIIR